MTERAVVITHNWETGETLHSSFTGSRAFIKAEVFMNAEQARGDFPEPEWAWFMHGNDEAVQVADHHFMAALAEALNDTEEES